MRALSSFNQICIFRDFVDMRKSIDGLSAIVVSDMGCELKEGSLFIFCNKKRTHMKILYFDRGGFALWLKRLNSEKFSWLQKSMEKEVVELSVSDLELLLSGVNIWTRFKKTYYTNFV